MEPDPVSPQLADGEFSPVFRLLTIFAYGTYADYLGETGPRGQKAVRGPLFPPRAGGPSVPEPRDVANPHPNCPQPPFAARAAPPSLRPDRRLIALWGRDRWSTWQ